MANSFLSSLIFLLCFMSHSFAQETSLNLIPNPGFEEVNICDKYDEPCCPEAWRSSTLKAFYYLDDAKNERSRKATFDGQRYVSLGMYNSKRAFDRSFIQTPLLCDLQAGKSYELSFYYKTPYHMIESFGVHFLDTLLIKRNNKHLKGVKPTLTFHNESTVASPDWILVKDTFTANGGENVLMIGNFATDENTRIVTEIKKKKRSYDYKDNRVYYLFDKFKLTLLDGSIDCDLDKRQALIYDDNVRHVIPTRSNVTAIEVLTKSPKPFEIEATKPEPDILVIGADSIVVSDEHFELPNILFDTNSDRLLPIAYPSLRKLSSYLVLNRLFKVTITGHTDDQGKPYFNQSLSERRAKAVHDYLLNQGVSKSRISYSGKGESQPLAPNDTTEGRAKNRRVEFSLLKN